MNGAASAAAKLSQSQSQSHSQASVSQAALDQRRLQEHRRLLATAQSDHSPGAVKSRKVLQLHENFTTLQKDGLSSFDGNEDPDSVHDILSERKRLSASSMAPSQILNNTVATSSTAGAKSDAKGSYYNSSGGGSMSISSSSGGGVFESESKSGSGSGSGSGSNDDVTGPGAESKGVPSKQTDTSTGSAGSSVVSMPESPSSTYIPKITSSTGALSPPGHKQVTHALTTPKKGVVRPQSAQRRRPSLTPNLDQIPENRSLLQRAGIPEGITTSTTSTSGTSPLCLTPGNEAGDNGLYGDMGLSTRYTCDGSLTQLTAADIKFACTSCSDPRWPLLDLMEYLLRHDLSQGAGADAGAGAGADAGAGAGAGAGAASSSVDGGGDTTISRDATPAFPGNDQSSSIRGSHSGGNSSDEEATPSTPPNSTTTTNSSNIVGRRRGTFDSKGIAMPTEEGRNRSSSGNSGGGANIDDIDEDCEPDIDRISSLSPLGNGVGSSGRRTRRGSWSSDIGTFGSGFGCTSTAALTTAGAAALISNNSFTISPNNSTQSSSSSGSKAKGGGGGGYPKGMYNAHAHATTPIPAMQRPWVSTGFGPLHFMDIQFCRRWVLDTFTLVGTGFDKVSIYVNEVSGPSNNHGNNSGSSGSSSNSAGRIGGIGSGSGDSRNSKNNNKSSSNNNSSSNSSLYSALQGLRLLGSVLAVSNNKNTHTVSVTFHIGELLQMRQRGNSSSGSGSSKRGLLVDQVGLVLHCAGCSDFMLVDTMSIRCSREVDV